MVSSAEPGSGSLAGTRHSFVQRVIGAAMLNAATYEEVEADRSAVAQAAGLPCALIRDLGATEFHGVPTHTAIAIGPAEAAEIDRITGPDGVIRTSLA